MGRCWLNTWCKEFPGVQSCCFWIQKCSPVFFQCLAINVWAHLHGAELLQGAVKSFFGTEQSEWVSHPTTEGISDGPCDNCISWLPEARRMVQNFLLCWCSLLRVLFLWGGVQRYWKGWWCICCQVSKKWLPAAIIKAVSGCWSPNPG